MADAAALQVCLAKIISIIENEASLLGGLGDELDELKRELQSMRAFLVDADRKRFPRNEGERRWVEDVTDMAYQVEDLIDEFAYYMNRPQGNGRFTRFLHKTIHFPKDLWMRHRIATKLQKIISVIKAIPERNERYRVHEEHNEGTSYLDDHHNTIRNLRESSLPARDDELVGIDGDKEKLMRWLTNADQPQRIVISVVGMGGIGKTTLVANAYNSQQVRQHFDCFAWISVSQTFQTQDLLRHMLKDVCEATKEMIPPDLSTMNYPELVKKLVHHLEQKKYIVVLDDVWDQNLWTQIERSLPDDGKHGSRILLTTRNEDIATFNFGVGCLVHNIQTLRKEDAWVLFCKKAFPNNPNSSTCCPPEQETLALELLKKCGGLPLAIVTLGGVMSSKKSVAEWIDVCNSLDWQLSNNQMLDAVKRILWISYNDLPYRLKQCFLYCSLIFPEDYPIKRKRLIRLWIAEGFVEEVNKRVVVTQEEVAERYLMELINRSMIQVASRNYSGRPKECKMHDFLREVALTASEKGKFCVVHDGSKSFEECEARRLSLQGPSEKEISSFKGSMLQLRSFFLFSRGISHTFPFPKFKMLRVLDLQDGPIDKLPDELVNLFNLRYLNLRGTMVKELPKAIGRLGNLQTLDIRDSKVEVLPAGILKLQKLQHLFMFRINYSGHLLNFEYVYGTRAPSNIWKLKNLQVLTCVAAEGDLVKGLKNMTQLTRIGITKVRREDEMELCHSIQNMNLLHCLFVMSKDDEEPLRMDALLTAPRYLKKLILVGKLERVPHWFESLQNLEELYLHWSRLEEDPLPYIQQLPNLGVLALSSAWQGERLCFVTGFRKLKFLTTSLPQLYEIIIEKGVMSALKTLFVYYCPKLKSIEGVEHLTNLEELYVPSHMDLQNLKHLLVEAKARAPLSQAMWTIPSRLKQLLALDLGSIEVLPPPVGS